MSVRGYSLNQGLLQPPVPNNASWTYTVRTKILNGTTDVALETAVNNWLATLDTVTVRPVILSVTNLGINAGKFYVIITYGFFTQIV